MRINDKIAELEMQVEPLRKQAETAKKYLVLRDELRTLEISVWLENLQKLKADRLKLQTDFETAQADQKKAQDELDRVYAQAEECSRLLHENDCAAEEKRSAFKNSSRVDFAFLMRIVQVRNGRLRITAYGYVCKTDLHHKLAV